MCWIRVSLKNIEPFVKVNNIIHEYPVNIANFLLLPPPPPPPASSQGLVAWKAMGILVAEKAMGIKVYKSPEIGNLGVCLFSRSTYQIQDELESLSGRKKMDFIR